MTEVKGELTAELALKLTFIMWEDMAEEEKQIGRKLDFRERIFFKSRWLADRGFVDRFGRCNVEASCLLCEYGKKLSETLGKRLAICDYCPVDWGANELATCTNGHGNRISYEYTPADEFLEYMKTHVRKEERNGDR